MIDFDEKVLKIYELGYRDAQRERDYDPQSHNETHALQQDIRKLKRDKENILGEIEDCCCMGEISKLLRQYGRGV